MIDANILFLFVIVSLCIGWALSKLRHRYLHLRQLRNARRWAEAYRKFLVDRARLTKS